MTKKDLIDNMKTAIELEKKLIETQYELSLETSSVMSKIVFDKQRRFHEGKREAFERTLQLVNRLA